jgi:hypothetical protein
MSPELTDVGVALVDAERASDLQILLWGTRKSGAFDLKPDNLRWMEKGRPLQPPGAA